MLTGYQKSARGAAALVLMLGLCAGCGSALLSKRPATEDRSPLQIGELIARAHGSMTGQGGAAPGCPGYLKQLVADGRLTIGLGIGTPDLGAVSIPEADAERVSSRDYSICGMPVRVEGRLILTREAFRAALAECEIIFVTSHSRFGAGPVFLEDGKGSPFRMQCTPEYEIIMPDSEVSGYGGTVIRKFRDPVKNKRYTVLAPDSTDLDNATTLAGYQLLVLSTCTSQKHFLDEIQAFRGGYPTTAILTRRSCCMDPEMRVFMRMLYEIFRGAPVRQVVRGMNEEYAAVAWKYIIRKVPPWKVIENLYTIGIHTSP